MHAAEVMFQVVALIHFTGLIKTDKNVKQIKLNHAKHEKLICTLKRHELHKIVIERNLKSTVFATCPIHITKLL